jgi:hypothetical protein
MLALSEATKAPLREAESATDLHLEEWVAGVAV